MPFNKLANHASDIDRMAVVVAGRTQIDAAGVVVRESAPSGVGCVPAIAARDIAHLAVSTLERFVEEQPSC